MDKANSNITFEEEADLYEKEALAEIKKQHFNGAEEMGEPYSTLQMGRRVIYRAKQELASRVEVVHGRWNMDKLEIGNPYDGNSTMIADIGNCSVCGYRCEMLPVMNYCPNCGAKMDGERKDNENP